MALERYFSVSNLTALRELALRRLSEKTERQLEAIMTSAPGAPALRPAPAAVERVLVAFDARDATRRLLHEGFRLAHGLRATFLALTVRSADQPYTSDEESALATYKRLAEDLGAEVIEVALEDAPSSERVAEAIAREVAERQITLLVVGCPSASGRSGQAAGLLGRINRRASSETVVSHLLRLPLTADLHITMR